MTSARIIERTILASLFAKPPAAGDIFVSAKGGSHFMTSRVRKLLDRAGGIRYTLFGMHIRKADLPAGVNLRPWPKAPAPRRSRAAEPPKVYPVTSLAKRQQVERKRIIALKHDEEDHRLKVDLAEAGEWRDPDDIDPRTRSSPRAKSARVVHGIRAKDVLTTMTDMGTLGRTQKSAAQRFRREYELGEIGLRGARSLAEEPGGFGPGAGPSASRLLHLERWQATAAAQRTNLPILLYIVIGNRHIRDYATEHAMNRGIATGKFLSALDLLRDYYKDVDDAKPKKEERWND